MERVFKIKTKSQPDVADQYPSERRYSASIVLGLSAVLLQFGLCSVLMGALVLHKMSLLESDGGMERLDDKLQRDLLDQTYLHYYINVPALISIGCFVMAVGDAVAFATGLLAWKRWYIDHNITFFFLSCSLSTLTSVVSLIISVLTISNMQFDRFENYEMGMQGLSALTLPLAVNIIVLSLVGTIWSFLATKIAYKGMRNSYPDDIVVKGGRVEVRTVNNRSSISHIPIEVINNFAVGKMAKYLPKKENNDLPKQESNAEYQQRVRKFLSAQPEEERHHDETIKEKD